MYTRDSSPHVAASPIKNKSPSPTKDTFLHCFPSHDYGESPKGNDDNYISA